MKSVMICLVCGSVLTRRLVVLSGKDPAVGAPEHKEGQPLAEPGHAYKSYVPIERFYGDVPAVSSIYQAAHAMTVKAARLRA